MPPLARLALASILLLAASFSAAADDTLDRDMREVERIRHLTFTGPVASETITRAELPGRLRAQLQKGLTYSFGEYEEMLRALYLVNPGSGDLMSPLLALLQSQVLAYYDPDTNRFYFVDSMPEGLNPGMPADVMRDIVVIHELVHALQDQRRDLSASDRLLRDDWDGGLALHAVIEGEASLVMLAAAVEKAGMPFDDLVANETLLNAAMGSIATASIDGGDAPKYFVESLKFPYLEGLRFVLAAYRRGGWKEVDRLLVDPPRSTREVMHPDEYFSRTVAAAPFTPHTPRGGFPDARLGQTHWAFLTGGQAAGWVDDRVSISLDRSCRPTVTITTRWESELAARDFEREYERFLDSKSAAASIDRDGSVVRVAYGFDAKEIREFMKSVPRSSASLTPVGTTRAKRATMEQQ
jgi:hypothetical protein